MNSENKRIAKNTMMLYFRQILILLVSLYTVRVVLNALGVEDYGIYSVIGGIVSLLSFLSGTMASATQRFFSFELGQNNKEKLKKTFSVNAVIYLIIACVALLLLETIGLWYVNEKLQIPTERFETAILIYHYSVFSFIAIILSTPFMAIIIAHEDMQIYAYVSIVEAIMKLTVAILIVYLPWDKLQLYGLLLFAVSLISTFIYIGISIKKYEECQFKKFYWNKLVFYEIVGFTGWTLFGQLTTVFRNQAVTILLNQVFNPVVVAARAVATSITGQINLFSNNFNVGIYPPIIKSYAANDKNNMFSLIINGSKITFFLMWVLALPMFLEMKTILHVWLKNPPLHAVIFTRLALVEVLINSISLPIITAARAPGKMKLYELSLGSIQIAIFIISWFVLKLGGAPYTVFVVAIIANLIMFYVRLLIVSKLIQLPVNHFIKNVVLPVFGVITFSTLPSLFIHFQLSEGLINSGLVVMTSILLSFVSMYYIGLDKYWREKIKGIVTNKIRRVIN